MKTFYKVAAIIAATALVFGIAFSVAGLCIGGTVEAAEDLVQIKGVHVKFPFVWIGDGKEQAAEGNSDQKNHTLGDAGDYDVDESYSEQIRELDWEIEYGSVTVQTGETFSVRGRNLYEKGFDSYIKNDVWHLECRYKEKKVNWGWKNGLEISGEDDAELVITIPENTVLEEASVNLGAGEAYFDGLTFEEAEFEVGAGYTRISNVTVRKEGDISVGMGELVLEAFEGQNMNIECGMGNVNGSGRLTGESEIECGIGEIDLKLSGAEADYNYEVTCGIGSVEIGSGKTYSGVTDKEIQNGAKDTIILDCGIGSITLEYEK